MSEFTVPKVPENIGIEYGEPGVLLSDGIPSGGAFGGIDKQRLMNARDRFRKGIDGFVKTYKAGEKGKSSGFFDTFRAGKNAAKGGMLPYQGKWMIPYQRNNDLFPPVVNGMPHSIRYKPKPKVNNLELMRELLNRREKLRTDEGGGFTLFDFLI